ncbi:MAG: VanZ family protein, partial [Gemmatimonadota bacterium]|nr:VanZ family protein [Gemmatimonadota bacterium]
MTPGHARAARIAYVAVILVATLSNLHPDWIVADAGPRLARAFHFAPHLSDAIDAARNVLLFAGLGAVWVATSRLARPGATLVRITVISFVFSAAIETLQLFSPVREASIIDVTTDTIGGLAGGLFTLGAFSLVDERNRKRSFLGVPALVFAAGYAVATLAEVFFPLFRQDLLPNLGGGITDRIGRAIVAIRPESITQVAVTDVLIYAPAGAFAVWALAEAGLAPWTGAILAAVLAAVLYPA